MQVGCGAVSVDFLATVAAYPKPDDKIRSTGLKVLLLPLLTCAWLINCYSM